MILLKNITMLADMALFRSQPDHDDLHMITILLQYLKVQGPHKWDLHMMTISTTVLKSSRS